MSNKSYIKRHIVEKKKKWKKENWSVAKTKEMQSAHDIAKHKPHRMNRKMESLVMNKLKMKAFTKST